MTISLNKRTETDSVAATSLISSELARYFIASGFAFLVDAGTLYLLTRFVEVHYLMSAAIGFILGLTTIYIVSVRWVFSKRRLKKTHHEVFIFSMIGIGGLGINELGMYLLTEKMMFHFMVSKILVTALVFMWNFGVRKLLLFR